MGNGKQQMQMQKAKCEMQKAKSEMRNAKFPGLAI